MARTAIYEPDNIRAQATGGKGLMEPDMDSVSDRLRWGYTREKAVLTGRSPPVGIGEREGIHGGLAGREAGLRREEMGRREKKKNGHAGKERADAAAGLQAGETGWDWAERVRRERGRLGWAGWSLGQIGERSLFSIFPFFYFVFKTEFKHKPNQI